MELQLKFTGMFIQAAPAKEKESESGWTKRLWIGYEVSQLEICKS
jgi:hypothetical protein